MSHNFRDAPLAALDDQHWRGLPPAKRKQVLIAFAEQILAHREELALAGNRRHGQAHPLCAQRRCQQHRQLHALVRRSHRQGVPRNRAHRAAQALATGNSVVLKPSEKSPHSALRLAELALAAGAAHGRGRYRLYRLDPRGQTNPCDGRSKQFETCLDRARRQVAQYRVRRLPGSRASRTGLGGQHFFSTRARVATRRRACWWKTASSLPSCNTPLSCCHRMHRPTPWMKPL